MPNLLKIRGGDLLLCLSSNDLMGVCDCTTGGGGIIGGGDCTYALSQSVFNIDCDQQDITLSVISPAGCSYHAVTQVGWLITQSGGSALAGTSYTVRALANVGVARTGTVNFYQGAFGPGDGPGPLKLVLTINQAECVANCATDPVPAACPAYPPLLVSYTLSGAPITPGTSILCNASPSSSINMTVTGAIGTCLWNGINNLQPDPADAELQLITVGAGSPYWQLRIRGDLQVFPGTCNLTSQFYRKTIGCDPVGTYSQVAPFNTNLTFPATVTVS